MARAYIISGNTEKAAAQLRLAFKVIKITNDKYLDGFYKDIEELQKLV